MRPRLASAALTLAALVAGCGEVVLRPDAGGSGDGPSADAPPSGPCSGVIAPENVFSCLSQGICDLIARCGLGALGDTNCDELPFEFGQDFDGLGSNELLAELLGAGRVTYDGAEAGQCVAALSTVACKTVVLNEATLLDGVCGAIVDGTVANGSRCQFDSECRSPVAVCVAAGSTCTMDGQPALGACQDAVAVGQSCENLPCRPGDHCVGTSPSRVCRPGDVGSSCVRDGDCDPALHCNAGQCRADVPEGSTCNAPSQCAGELDCVIPLMMVTGTCRPTAAVGDTCSNACWGASGLRCHQPDPMMPATCQPLPTQGMTCADDVECSAGFFGMVCDGLTCQTPGDVGDTCDNMNSCNLGLFCSRQISGGPTGTCLAPQALGAGCSSDVHCLSGSCQASVCAEQAVCTL